MTILKRYKDGERTSFIFCMAILAEACTMKCPILELMEGTKDSDDAANINAVVNWLVSNYPDKYKLRE